MSIIGIDVSTHNGKLDWSKLKSAGVQYAIIRAGYGRYAVDSQFENNISGALAVGIPVGIYWFSYALNADAAKEEAKKCCDTIRGYKITLPVFFDFEYDTVRYGKENGVTLGKTAFNNHAVAFCEEVKAQGYTPGVYYNLDYYRNMVDAVRLKGYVQWYAQYASSPSISGYDLWQYTSSGTFSGVSGRFDVNVLENTSLLSGDTTAPSYKVGWNKDTIGWWYVHDDGSYNTSAWEYINGNWYYFDDTGYMVRDTTVTYNGKIYTFDGDGHVTVAEEAKELRFNTLGEVTQKSYRDTLDKLIAKGYLAGKGSTGGDMIIDLSEDSVRILVILDRTGVFDK